MPRDVAGPRLDEAADGRGGVEVALFGVSKEWGRFRALDDVSFTIAAGSFTVLLGPSGCGKTTCLRLIAGLERAGTGRVMIGGKDVTAAPPAERGVAMVFQSYALFPHLTAAENILFGLKARRVPAAERAQRLDRAVGILGIEALLTRRPGQLSGGQQQRVALGRAIVAETPVCLMDEPLSNLDAQLRAEMRVEIVALQRRLGITMIYVTHDQTEAMSMADRVILLNKGRVEQDAPPAELYARPDTLFAARFIGTPPMNLLPLARVGTAMVVRGTTGPAFAAASERSLLAGLRPEALMLAEAGLPLRLDRAEYLGSDTVLHCRCGPEALPVLIRRPGRIDAAGGAMLHAAFAPESVQLFEADSGRRLLRQAAPALSEVTKPSFQP
ncbi:MAG: ABC transporter ATP-binding protein [Rhodospirillales bacterium]|nr:ABC transporter ATP-binding protein [Rhodospirillales bacterium]